MLYDDVFQLIPALATNIATSSLILYIFSPMAQHPLVQQRLLVIEA